MTAQPPVSTQVEGTLVYADGSALSRFLDEAPGHAAWLAWVSGREDRLVTSALGAGELRRIAASRGRAAKDTVAQVLDDIGVLRVSDQSLKVAAHVAVALPSFVALQLGIAVAHPDIDTVATYDVDLARVSALYRLAVVSPGWPDRWWERAP